MTTLPVQPVVEPSVLRGQTNGQLPASLLHAVKMPGGGPDALLVEPAARAMRAMVAAAARDGILLCSTSSYRPLAGQIALLHERYEPVGQRKADIYYDGQWWEHRSGAVVATPGKSNHGKGLADDLSEQLDRDPQPESISDRAVAWLVANAWTYGYSFELQSEPWHVRYCTGDAIPAAVIAYEQGDDMPKLARVRTTGAILITTGVERRHIADAADLATQAQVWGLRAWVDIDESQVPHLGRDVSESAGALTLTQEELEAALREALDGATVAVGGVTLTVDTDPK